MTLKVILLTALSIVFETNLVKNLLEPVPVWRLYVHHQGQKRLVAESDRPIERDSMAAAASSVGAVVTGQRYVAEVPAVAAQVLTCPTCGAPAVPDDAAAVTCAYCRSSVPQPDAVRAQAASSKALSSARSSTGAIIAKLRDQPRAAHANAWLLALSAVMFGAWPLGWGLVAAQVLGDGFQAADVVFLLLPFAAVLAGFFFARGRLADRGALQLLTLGFGALAPRREGEPSRCRRCQGALPSAGLGGVATCRYCGADNIVGLDLRPSVDQARAEQQTFDEALRRRGRERALWSALTVVAGLVLLGWAVATAGFVASLESGPAVAPHGPPAAPAPRPPPRPHPNRRP